jgi:hypothetical protein
MYAVVHGGTDQPFRRESAEYLAGLPFDGYAVGGSLGKDRVEMLELLTFLMPLLPGDKPNHLLGIADPESSLAVVPLGARRCGAAKGSHRALTTLPPPCCECCDALSCAQTRSDARRCAQTRSDALRWRPLSRARAHAPTTTTTLPHNHRHQQPPVTNGIAPRAEHAGVDTMDSCNPTRVARHGTLLCMGGACGRRGAPLPLRFFSLPPRFFSRTTLHPCALLHRVTPPTPPFPPPHPPTPTPPPC